MKLLALGINYAPELIGIGPYTSGLLEALAAGGDEVKIVTGKPYYPAWKLPEGYRQFDYETEDAGGVEILRAPLYVPRHPGGKRRIVHHMSFAASAVPPMLARAMRWRPDVVLCIAPSLFSIPVAALAARMAGAKLWVHVQDFEIDAAFALGLLSEYGQVAVKARNFESSLLQRADIVSTIGPKMVAKLRAKQVDPGKIRELRNWAEPGFGPQYADGDTMRAELGLQGKTVALYAGNIANKQGLELPIEAAQMLADRPDIAIVICGEGSQRERLQAMGEGLPNLHFHPPQPAQRMASLLAMADMHLLPQHPQAADLVLPSKLTNILLSERPVIASAAPGTGLHDEVQGCGILTPPGDAAAMAGAIAELADDPAKRARLGKAAGERAAERWQKKAIIEQWRSELHALAAG
ncbi:WcaI family glycosyltransferase [Paraurantiacibacter namhicola]|uniref:Alpha-D-kanosaminyltransferase n=1 Tax=Paraurantiacibacter namhicola TaxID=645517 RepID=A0A1C7D628_9SPHN|nr:WcaI family glycosyltransferase [Paraurantiacibacter namhicola]ANU06914.1 Alpha-D-kanosaminyltransferase [Paraurantiacibacter namhicola]